MSNKNITGSNLLAHKFNTLCKFHYILVKPVVTAELYLIMAEILSYKQWLILSADCRFQITHGTRQGKGICQISEDETTGLVFLNETELDPNSPIPDFTPTFISYSKTAQQNAPAVAMALFEVFLEPFRMLQCFCKDKKPF